MCFIFYSILMNMNFIELCSRGKGIKKERKMEKMENRIIPRLHTYALLELLTQDCLATPFLLSLMMFAG